MLVLTLLPACESETALSLDEDEPALDYSEQRYWLARGDRDDDVVDGDLPGFPDMQAEATADTFYVHPTTLGLSDVGLVGNGDPLAEAQRRAVDETAETQAPAFASATQIWAPRYRQATLGSLASDPGSARVSAAKSVAYRDVLAAFDYYMADHNNGRPIVLAGHSQGATWLVQLIRDRVEGTDVAEQLVAAYLIGEFVGPDTFETLGACDNPEAVGCVISWVTVAVGGTPRSACGHETLSPGCTSSPVNTDQTPICVNPITWRNGPQVPTDNAQFALASGPFEGLFVSGWLSAWCDDGILRIDDRVEVDGVGTLRENIGPFVDDGDYHAVDIELFFGSIRENLPRRVAAR